MSLGMARLPDAFQYKGKTYRFPSESPPPPPRKKAKTAKTAKIKKRRTTETEEAFDQALEKAVKASWKITLGRLRGEKRERFRWLAVHFGNGFLTYFFGDLLGHVPFQHAYGDTWAILKPFFLLSLRTLRERVAYAEYSRNSKVATWRLLARGKGDLDEIFCSTWDFGSSFLLCFVVFGLHKFQKNCVNFPLFVDRGNGAQIVCQEKRSTPSWIKWQIFESYTSGWASESCWST